MLELVHRVGPRNLRRLGIHRRVAAQHGPHSIADKPQDICVAAFVVPEAADPGNSEDYRAYLPAFAWNVAGHDAAPTA